VGGGGAGGGGGRGGEIGGGGLTGEFLTPNVLRRWGVEWDVRLECAGEEIRWRSESTEGGGLGVRILRGGGGGGVVRPEGG
jgi:hypothetical protein